MAGNEAEGQIAALVFRAISLFETLLSILNTRLAENGMGASHFARFKLWVGSMGAHRSSGGRSLEYRLRDASAVKGQIVSLLQDLNDSLAHGANLRDFDGPSPAPNNCWYLNTGASFEKGVSDAKEDYPSSDPTDAELEHYFRGEEKPGASELTDVLEDIGHVVDCLLRLSITIRNPAPHDHFRSRAGTNISTLYEEWDIKHAREKFPNAALEIVERLGRATAQRRQYFKYREDHINRLAEGLVLETTPSEFGGSLPEKATTIASSIPNYLKEKETETLSTSSKYAHFSDSESIASMTSYAPSGVHHGQLRVPPIPKESSAGPFRCPFCCLILSVNSKEEWKKHVFRDLRPYVCTESSCTRPDQQYQRRADWMVHMKQEHWKMWNCPFGCSDIFQTCKSFTTHVVEEHPADIAARRLDTLQDLSSHFDARRIEGQCPLCRDFRLTTEKQFGSHVGNHLEQLALFALPNHGAEDESEGGSGNSNQKLHWEGDGQSSDSSFRSKEDTGTKGQDLGSDVGSGDGSWDPDWKDAFNDLEEAWRLPQQNFNNTNPRTDNPSLSSNDSRAYSSTSFERKGKHRSDSIENRDVDILFKTQSPSRTEDPGKYQEKNTSDKKRHPISDRVLVEVKSETTEEDFRLGEF